MSGVNAQQDITASIENVKFMHVRLMQIVGVASYVIVAIAIQPKKHNQEDTVINGHHALVANNALKTIAHCINVGIGTYAQREWSAIVHIAMSSHPYALRMRTVQVRISAIEVNVVAIVLLIISHAGLIHDLFTILIILFYPPSQMNIDCYHATIANKILYFS